MYSGEQLDRMLEHVVIKSQTRKFGKLKFIRPIDAGSIGEVHVIEEIDTGEKFALKVQMEKLNAKRDAPEVGLAFIADAECAGIIGTHPNVIRTFTYLGCRYGDSFLPAIIMEYFDSKPLQAYVNTHHGGLSLEEALNLLLQVTTGLSAVHKAGYIHRDLTALNVLISKDGTHAKISDFGLARKINYSSLRSSKYYQFIAPELTKFWPSYEKTHKVKGDECSDLYSVGALLFFMLTEVFLTDESEIESIKEKVRAEIDKEEADRGRAPDWKNYPEEQKIARIKEPWQQYIEGKLQTISHADVREIILNLTHFDPRLRKPATADELCILLEETLRKHAEEQKHYKREVATLKNNTQLDSMLQKLGKARDKLEDSLLFLVYKQRQEPDNPLHYYKLGVFFEDLAMCEHTLTYLSLALQHSKERHPHYLAAMGIALSNLGREREGLQMVKQISKLPKTLESIPTLTTCGNVYKRNGLVDDAYGCYSKAIELDKWNIAALSGLGWCYAKNGDRSTAQEHTELARYTASEQNSELGMWRALRGGAEVYEVFHDKEKFNECFLGMLSVMPHRALWIRQGYIDSMRQKDMLSDFTLSCVNRLQAEARPIQQIVKDKVPYQPAYTGRKAHNTIEADVIDAEEA